MTKLLDLIERVAPRMPLYPTWAQRLFATTFALTLASFFVWVLLAPAASRRADATSVFMDVGVGQTQVAAGGAAQRSGVLTRAPDAAANRTLSLLNGAVTYEEDAQTGAILPRVPYLAVIRSGGPVGGIDSGEFEYWYEASRLPQLDVKLGNLGNKPAFLSRAAVAVGRSSPDLEPIPIFLLGTSTSPRSFGIRNEGWGRIEGATASYAVAFGSRVQPRIGSALPYTSAIASFDAFGSVDVSDGVAQAHLPGRGTATVWGTLAYSWHDASGAVHRQHLAFVTTVELAQGPPVVGAPAPPTGLYDVELRVSGSHYREVLRNFDRVIRPSTPDRFLISLYTERSSIHRNVVVELHYLDGHDQRSRPIEVRVFRPRDAPVFRSRL